MDRQQEFVLRTLEERDIRFVRLWFTDVLGTLKSVAVAPAELEGAFAEGIGFDGSAIEGFARVYESDMIAEPDPADVPGAAVARRVPRASARMFCDILMPDGVAVLRRSALRAQARAGPGRRDGLHLLHPPRDRVLPAQGAARGRARSRCRSTAAATSTTPRTASRHDFRRHGDHDAGVDGHLGGVQPPRGRARAAGDRPALRRRAHHRRQHHDVPARDEGGRARAGRATRRSCRSRSPTTPARACTRTCRCSRATATRSTSRAPSSSCPRSAGRSSPGCSSTRRRSPPSRNQWVNSYKRLWGAAERTAAGGEAPAYVCWGHNNRSALVRVPMYKPQQGQLDPGRVPLAGLRLQPVPGLRGDPRPPGSRASRRATSCRPAPRTTCGR